MKKVFLTYSICAALIVMARAQDYQKFKLGFGMGFTSTDLVGMGFGGILFTLEPGYHLNDHLVIGLRLETANTQIDLVNGGYRIRSYTLNSQCYFRSKGLRPLVGAGFGVFSMPSNVPVSERKKFGFYPRIGFDVGHFFLTMEYNLISQSESTLPYPEELNNNYFGLRFGFFTGGVKKKSGETVD
jgi:hypothetical protein